MTIMKGIPMMEILKNFFKWLFKKESGIAWAMKQDLEEYAAKQRGDKNYKLIQNFKLDRG